MNYELLIGLRYTRAQPREGAANRFISFIALISMLGLALGVAALIVVLSVMNGFQKELRERIFGVVSHVQISSESGEFADWSKVVQGAARRGIAGRESGGFSLRTRNIGDYERDFLKAQLLACPGREWVQRQEVARRLARRLGFARTGPVIEATVNSLIISLLRSGDLQKRRDEVHRA